MAQLGLIVNQHNCDSIHLQTKHSVQGVHSAFEETQDNFECTFFRQPLSKPSLKRKRFTFVASDLNLSDHSNDSTDTESEPESRTNVVRWLESLPSNLGKVDCEDTPDIYACKLKHTTESLKWQSNSEHKLSTFESHENMSTLTTDNIHKSTSRSLKGKSTHEICNIPLNRKPMMTLEKHEFIEENKSMREKQKKQQKMQPIPFTRKKRLTKRSSQISKKSSKADLRSVENLNQSTLTLKKNKSSLLNASRQSIGRCTSRQMKKKSEQILKYKISEKDSINRRLANNKRLLKTIKDIVNTVDRSNHQLQSSNKLSSYNNNKIKDYAEESVITNPQVVKGEIKKPIFRNPEIERTLDDAMKRTLNTYIHSQTWDNLKMNANVVAGEPPLKKRKHAVLPLHHKLSTMYMQKTKKVRWNAS